MTGLGLLQTQPRLLLGAPCVESSSNTQAALVGSADPLRRSHGADARHGPQRGRSGSRGRQGRAPRLPARPARCQPGRLRLLAADPALQPGRIRLRPGRGHDRPPRRFLRRLRPAGHLSRLSRLHPRRDRCLRPGVPARDGHRLHRPLGRCRVPRGPRRHRTQLPGRPHHRPHPADRGGHRHPRHAGARRRHHGAGRHGIGAPAPEPRSLGVHRRRHHVRRGHDGHRLRLPVLGRVRGMRVAG